MLTGLKVSPLVCKRVFYRPNIIQRENPVELNIEDRELKK